MNCKLVEQGKFVRMKGENALHLIAVRVDGDFGSCRVCVGNSDVRGYAVCDTFTGCPTGSSTGYQPSEAAPLEKGEMP
jgi:hypothetical protein